MFIREDRDNFWILNWLDEFMIGHKGFMYGVAVSILSQCWEYGECLRKWHNKEYGYDGDGVVNPAVITVG